MDIVHISGEGEVGNLHCSEICIAHKEVVWEGACPASFSLGPISEVPADINSAWDPIHRLFIEDEFLCIAVLFLL
jgi:hypothetical protein